MRYRSNVLRMHLVSTAVIPTHPDPRPTHTGHTARGAVGAAVDTDVFHALTSNERHATAAIIAARTSSSSTQVYRSVVATDSCPSIR